MALGQGDGVVFSMEELTQAKEDYDAGEFSLGTFNSSLEKNDVRVGDIHRRLINIKKEFGNEREVQAAFRQQVLGCLGSICSKELEGSVRVCGKETPSSESLLKDGFLDFSLPKKTPFVTITYMDGNSEDIFFPETAIKDIMSSVVLREIVRKVMRYVHNRDIALLRTYSLSRKIRTAKKDAVKRTADSMESEDSQTLEVKELDGSQVHPNKPVPIRTVLVAQEVVKKLMPAHPNIMADPLLTKDYITKKEQEVRTNITAVLNYFKFSYDFAGKIIQTSPKDGSSKKPRM